MKNWKCYRKTDQHKIESVFDEKGLKVCDIHYYLNEESESSAKLISCAPEMLEMLMESKKTISRIKNSMMAHPSFEYGSEFEDYVNLATEQENEIEQLIIKATII